MIPLSSVIIRSHPLSSIINRYHLKVIGLVRTSTYPCTARILLEKTRGTNDRDERSFMVDRLKHHLGQVTSFTQPELCQLLLVCHGRSGWHKSMKIRMKILAKCRFLAQKIIELNDGGFPIAMFDDTGGYPPINTLTLKMIKIYWAIIVHPPIHDDKWQGCHVTRGRVRTSTCFSQWRDDPIDKDFLKPPSVNILGSKNGKHQKWERLGTHL